MKIIALNGPPRSGKDTFANLLDDELVESHIKPISFPMRKASFEILGLGEYSFEKYEYYKDKPIPIISGETLRSFMIKISEEFIKPNYGDGYWVEQVVRSTDCKFLIIPDLGFEFEKNILSKYNTTIVKLEKKGHTFKNDSREYVKHSHFTVENNGTIEDLNKYVKEIIAWVT